MTDISSQATAVPNRLNVSARVTGDGFALRVTPIAATCRNGSIRASVLSYAMDVVAGIAVDGDEGTWTFTSDMVVRMNPVPAPPHLDAIGTVLRQGARSSTCEARLVDDRGALVGYGTLGFARVARRPGDPVKHMVDPRQRADAWAAIPPIEVGLPEAAGVKVVDGAAGVVEVAVVDELRNPAGTIQGAMVALVAEVAAEEMISARLGRPALVCDLDIRFLAQGRVGPIRTSAEWLGDTPGAWVRVELHDTSSGQLLTTVLARAPVTVSADG